MTTSCVLSCVLLFIAIIMPYQSLFLFFGGFLFLQQGRTLELLPNPQTDEILSLLGLEHKVTVPSSAWESRYHGVDKPGAFSLLASSAATAEEPSFDESTGYPFEVDLVGAGKDPNEIELDG